LRRFGDDETENNASHNPVLQGAENLGKKIASTTKDGYQAFDNYTFDPSFESDNATMNYGFEMEQKVRRVIAPCPRNKIYEKEMARVRDDRGKKKLVTACCICVLFMILELVGGYVAGSLAIMSDAAHMAADVSTFLVSLYAAHLTRKGIKPHKTFGFHRAEVLGALFSITSLWVVTLMLLIEASKRIVRNDVQIDSKWMLIVATFGIFFNGVLIYVLHGPGLLDGNHTHSHGGGGHGHSHGSSEPKSSGHGHGHSHDDAGHNDIMTDNNEKSHLVESDTRASGLSNNSDVEDKPNINVHAALMHVICDLIQSVGVFLTAIIIKIWPSWTIMDPVLTLMFSVIVVITTKNTFINIMTTLMEGTPDGVDIGEIQDELLKIEGVQDVHAMHVWTLTTDKHNFSCHILLDPASEQSSRATSVTNACQSMLQDKFKFFSITVQVEAGQNRIENGTQNAM